MAEATVENIEKFNAYAAAAFAQLYASFPEGTKLDCSQIVYGKPLPSNVTNKELAAQREDPKIQFCGATLRWLMDTGYFRGSHSDGWVQVSGAVLSVKGFEVLATPEALSRSKAPVGEQLVEIAKQGPKEGLKDQIGEAMRWIM